jgi:hypothetical protein
VNVRRTAVALVVLALVAPACSRDGGDDDSYTLTLDGRAEIVQDGATREVDEGDHDVALGDTVRMVEGDAELALPGERSVLLRAGRAGRASTVIDVAAVPDVVEGDAVVVAGDDVHFTVGDVDVQLADGAARVQRALSVTIAVYAGGAEVRSAGRALPGGLPALRQVSVPATGLLPRTPTPLLYDDKAPDAWDRRFLGDAIDLGAELDRRARGFTGQVGPRVSVDATLLRRVLPPLASESTFGETLLEDVVRSPGEALVGAAIAVEADGVPFADRWDNVFSFRADGAKWGLVALDQRVQRDALLASINDAFGRSPILFASPSISGGTDGSTPTTATTTPGSGDTTTTTTQPDDGGDPTIPPTTVPPLTIPPITVPPLVPAPDDTPPDDQGSADSTPDVVDVVGDVVDGLLGEDVPKS